jgi:hypothetical protein
MRRRYTDTTISAVFFALRRSCDADFAPGLGIHRRASVHHSPDSIMRRSLPVLALFCFAYLPLSAQLLKPITARDLFPDVAARARSELALDAVPTNILFAGIKYQNVGLTMDTSSGKATGWLYRYYSPSLDSMIYYLAVKPAIGDPIVAKLQMDTITSLLPFNVGTTPLIEPWADSPDALAGSMSGGADAFYQTNPGASVLIAVLLNNPAANPNMPLGEFWMFVHAASADTMTCLIWGDSGIPLRCGSKNSPKIASVPILLARVGEAYSYDVDALGNPAPVYEIESGPSGMTIDTVTGLISWTPALQQLGLNAVTVRARNFRGSDEQSFEINVQESGSRPRFVSTPPTEVNAGEPYTYSISATGSPRPTFQILNPPQGMLLDGSRGILLWTPSRVQAGDHDIRLVAVNTVGADTQRFTLKVFSSPLLRFVPDGQATVGQLFTLTLSAEGYPAPVYSLIAAPAGLSIDAVSGNIAWTPTSGQEGKHTMVAEARNTAGFNQQPFAITVDPATDVENLDALPFEYHGCFPNPAPRGGPAYLEFGMKDPGYVEARFFDALGRQLCVLASGFGNPGRYRLPIPSDLPSGIYRYMLRVGGRSASGLIVLQ